MARHVLYLLKAEEMHYRLVYHTYRLCRCLGYKSILKSCDFQSHPAVKMESCKKCFQSEDETERMLQDRGSEGDSVFSESENSSQSESESEDNSEESATENSEGSNSDETATSIEKNKGSGLEVDCN